MRGKHNGWLAGALLVGVACLVGSLWLFSGGGAEPAGRPAGGTQATWTWTSSAPWPQRAEPKPGRGRRLGGKQTRMLVGKGARWRVS